jgi:hypothetical protein
MRSRLVVPAVLLATALLLPPARAEEGAAAPPAALAKVDVPFLDALVGDWNASVEAMGEKLKGTDRWTKVVDGTAWLHELQFGEGNMAFHGLGVLRPDADGKGVSMWWFDSMGPGNVWRFHGTVGPDGFEVASDEGGMKATKSLRKKGDAFEYVMTVNGEKVVTGAWAKAAGTVETPAPVSGPLVDLPLAKAQVGTWEVEGTMGGETHEGTTSFRGAVGGQAVVQTYEVEGPVRLVGLGVSTLAEDGKTLKTLWWDNYFPAPLVLDGTISPTGWRARGKHSLHGEMEVLLTKTDDGLHVVYSGGGKTLFEETYSREE